MHILCLTYEIASTPWIQQAVFGSHVVDQWSREYEDGDLQSLPIAYENRITYIRIMHQSRFWNQIYSTNFSGLLVQYVSSQMDTVIT